jgi:hypothetical protein
MISTVDPQKTKVAIEWIKKLANGINPIDGSVLSDKDVVNNVHISRCLFYVAELLEDAGKRRMSSAKQYDQEFSLTQEDLSKIYISERTTVSVFVREINKVISDDMKPLSVSTVTSWLVRNGYMDEVSSGDGRKTRIPSDLGKSIGLSSELKSGPNGEYTSVIYDAKAQGFILEKLLNKQI